MSSALDRTVRDLGEGSLVPLDSGRILFKLDSYEANPIVTPQQLGLTWDIDGEPDLPGFFVPKIPRKRPGPGSLLRFSPRTPAA